MVDQEFTPEKMIKRLVLCVLSMMFDPLGTFYSIFKITMKGYTVRTKRVTTYIPVNR